MGLLRLAMMVLVVTAAGAQAKDAAAVDSWVEGRLLVATERLDDPNFRQSVVYMVQHGAEGGFGLIVNRRVAVGPLDRLMESLGHEAPPQAGRMITLYDGGPVGRERAIVLHGAGYAGKATLELGNGLGLTPLGAALDDIAHGVGPEDGLLIVGHAGWGPGQLEQEIAEGVWTIVDAEPAFVLDLDIETKWQRALARDGQDL